MGKKDKRAAKGTSAATVEVRKPKKLHGTVRAYVQHILVCTDRKSKACKKGGPQILKAFQATIKARKLQRQVIVSEIGHVGGCGLGPNVIVYPDGVWYGQVTESDVEEIVESHLQRGVVVERLLRGARKDDPCFGCAMLGQHDGIPNLSIPPAQPAAFVAP